MRVPFVVLRSELISMKSLPSRRGSSRRSRQPVGFVALEPRHLLTAVVYDGPSMTIWITGDASAETVLVEEPDANTLTVSSAATGTLTFNRSIVNLVDARMGGGDDLFVNNTTVASRVFGQQGNDHLIGGSVADVLNGGPGNDLLEGRVGNDRLLGDAGDDQMYGGEGLDLLIGYFGNDQMWGGAGDDLLFGQFGDDQLMGGDGADRLRGNGDHDTLFGDAGDDTLFGDQGDDELNGGDGSDWLFGFSGNDTLKGDAGLDRLYGHDGDDLMLGGDGNDLLRGGNGHDTLFGGAGSDRLMGEAGDDLLRGDAHNDVLLGGAGMDSLYGGMLGDSDQLWGGDDGDRLLTQEGDQVNDLNGEDAEVRFVDETSEWTDSEILVLDEALGVLVATTGNQRLLRDSLSEDPLTLYKYADLGGAAGINYLETSGEWRFVDGKWQIVYTYHREIHILEWDETSSWYNEQFQSVTLHEIGHNWDSALELASISAGAEALWETFLAESDWLSENPGDPGAYSLSLDGQWWYRSDAIFAENYGRTNPYEDWSTVWELYFDADADEGLRALLADKLGLLQQFFSFV